MKTGIFYKKKRPKTKSDNRVARLSAHDGYMERYVCACWGRIALTRDAQFRQPHIASSWRPGQINIHPWQQGDDVNSLRPSDAYMRQ